MESELVGLVDLLARTLQSWVAHQRKQDVPTAPHEDLVAQGLVAAMPTGFKYHWVCEWAWDPGAEWITKAAAAGEGLTPCANCQKIDRDRHVFRLAI